MRREPSTWAGRVSPAWRALALAVLVAGPASAGQPTGRAAADPGVTRTDISAGANRPLSLDGWPKAAAKPAATPRPPRSTVPTPTPAPAGDAPAVPAPAPAPDPLSLDPQQVVKNVSTVAVFALASLAPAAVLMVTAFVRINVVLVLLRQALGSPQVPGNQVLTALALLLTALVMQPVGETVYRRAVAPYARGERDEAAGAEAFRAGSAPIKAFMIEQIRRTNHAHYLWAIHDESAAPGQADPVFDDEFSLGVVATAFLLSELTTALFIGFLLYLPFLVVDLVVSAVLAAMGLFMLPPSLVALPLKLILFVLADGWLHVATMLLRSFGPVAASP